MADTKNDVDYVSAPENYADIFKQYYPYIVNLCVFFGINTDNAEDVASEIFIRFMERGSLEKFDPELTFEYQGTIRPAKFKNYLSRAVEMYSRGHRDRQRKLARRELQAVGPAQSSYSWLDQYGSDQQDHSDGVHDMIDEEAEARFVRALLSRVPPRSTHDRCDLVALYDAARAQIILFGEYDIKILREKFGVSSTAMHTWMWWLKENLADIYGIPTPAKRPRRSRSTSMTLPGTPA